VGPRAGLDGCGKSRPSRVSIPRPYSQGGVAITTEPSGSADRVLRKVFGLQKDEVTEDGRKRTVIWIAHQIVFR
jgi:hypothetical protein